MDNQEAIRKFQSLIEKVDEPLQISFQSMHQGFPTATLTKFLIARDWDIAKAHKMKPIVPAELYRLVRDTQLIGLSGFSKEGIPVIIVGVGQSTHDKASVDCYVQSHIQMNEYRDRIVLPEATKKYGRHISTCIKILDMTGLRLSALNQIKLLTAISTIDDLNYPEKTDTYYIVNVPYIFSACWKVVKPLLHERTRNRIQIMDYSSLPHFCRKQSSGSARVAADGTTTNCFSLDHPFHQQLYSYVKQQAGIAEAATALKQSSVHVRYPPPDPEEVKIVKTIESELRRVGDLNGLNKSFSRVQGNGF
ncbi:Phosphatidylinositol/phosphatidylcholine transfer protein SFH2 [Linum perenne]